MPRLFGYKDRKKSTPAQHDLRVDKCSGEEEKNKISYGLLGKKKKHRELEPLTKEKKKRACRVPVLLHGIKVHITRTPEKLPPTKQEVKGEEDNRQILFE